MRFRGRIPNTFVTLREVELDLDPRAALCTRQGEEGQGLEDRPSGMSIPYMIQSLIKKAAPLGSAGRLVVRVEGWGYGHYGILGLDWEHN